MGVGCPYLTLLRESAEQREHPLREVFNGPRYLMPNDLPLWHVVCNQARRWLRAGSFEKLAHDLRAVLRLAGRHKEPTTIVAEIAEAVQDATGNSVTRSRATISTPE